MSAGRSLSKRVPWNVAKALLRENEIDIGTGWPTTMDRVPDGGNFDEACIESSICSQKNVRIYEGEADELQAIADALMGITLPQSPFRNRFPYVLDDEQLSAIEDHEDPILVFKKREDDAFYFVFSHKTVYFQRTHFDRLAYGNDTDGIDNEKLRNALQSSDEMIVIERENRQSFQAVVIQPATGYLQVRVDLQNIRGNAFHVRDLNDHHEKVLSELLTVSTTRALKPLNLFPLISNLYGTPTSASRIVRVGYIGSDDIARNESSALDNVDIRNSASHIKALEPLNGAAEDQKIFEIKLVCDSQVLVSAPPSSLIMKSTETQAKLIEPRLMDFTVEKVLFEKDFATLISSMLS